MKQNLKMTYTKLVGKNNAVPCKFKFSARTFSTSNKQTSRNMLHAIM